MDRSEIILFGEVRSALQSQLWKTDEAEFRRIVEEAYYLLPEDYRPYILSQLENVPDEVRRLSPSDFTSDHAREYVYKGDKPLLDEFARLYVRHVDLDHFQEVLDQDTCRDMWACLGLVCGVWDRTARRDMGGEQKAYMKYRHMSSAPVLCLPFTHLTLPRNIHLSRVAPQGDFQIVPSLDYRFLVENLTVTITEDLLRQSFHEYTVDWEGYQEMNTIFDLSKFAATNGDYTLRIEVETPELFFSDLKTEDSPLQRLLQHYQWSIHFEVVLQEGTPKSSYKQILDTYADTHDLCKIKLSERTWTA